MQCSVEKFHFPAFVLGRCKDGKTNEKKTGSVLGLWKSAVGNQSYRIAKTIMFCAQERKLFMLFLGIMHRRLKALTIDYPMEELSPCFACGAPSLNIEGPTHRYMLSSPGCWAMAGEVWAREYSNILYWKSHHLTVDCYACQHPGKPIRQAINSVGIHLCSLYAIFEKGLNPMEAARYRQALAQVNKQERFFHWLTPPLNPGEVTIANIWEADNPQKHHTIAKRWAESVWEAWSDHHGTVRKWAGKM